MNIKNVVNEFGENVDIDYDTRKLYVYDNDSRKITWNAAIVENGAATAFWTNFTEDGTVDSVEERLRTWNNLLLPIYAKMVNGNSNKNDPDGTIFKEFAEKVKANENKFFTESGNFRKKYTLSEEDIISIFGVQ